MRTFANTGRRHDDFIFSHYGNEPDDLNEFGDDEVIASVKVDLDEEIFCCPKCYCPVWNEDVKKNMSVVCSAPACGWHGEFNELLTIEEVRERIRDKQ